MDIPPKSRIQGLEHCSAKAGEILEGPLSEKSGWTDDRRWWLQLGFNLGRYSELSDEGRRVWDNWKAAIESKDATHIEFLIKHMKDYAAEEKFKESD